MWQYQNTDELYHHGVLGMKWGVRRTPEQLGYFLYTDKQKNKMKKAAQKELRGHIKSSTKKHNRLSNEYDYEMKRSKKLLGKAYKSKIIGNMDKHDKYFTKANKHTQKALDVALEKGAIAKHIKNMNKTLNKIDKNILKSGKDYVTGLNLNYNILNINKERYLDLYKGTKKISSYSTKDSVTGVPGVFMRLSRSRKYNQNK